MAVLNEAVPKNMPGGTEGKLEKPHYR